MGIKINGIRWLGLKSEVFNFFVCLFFFRISKIVSVFVPFSLRITVVLNFIVLLTLEDDMTFCLEIFPGS